MRIVDADGSRRASEGPLPLHTGLIIDGSRRWALARGIPARDAHRHGEAAMCSVLAVAAQVRLPFLTFYCLSTENLQRPNDEVEQLGRLDTWLWTPAVVAQVQRLGLRVELIGDLDHPGLQSDAMLTLLAQSRGAGPCVTFAVNYGGRQDIEIAAARGGGPLAVNLAAADQPDLDLVVRTGGEQRLSNFKIWQAAYAELVFTDTLWPDFTGLHLLSAIDEYQQRRRSLGR